MQIVKDEEMQDLNNRKTPYLSKVCTNIDPTFLKLQ